MKQIIMNDNAISVDTNILIYLYDSSEKKRSIAENILAKSPKISTQVISEYINVTRRLLSLSKIDVLTQCAALLKDCEIIPVSSGTLTVAAGLIHKYDLQIFDAIIVASALEASCSVLYSEDMQHGLVIDNLTILNPFV
jgi:predicted nucleic acid-binding protein